MLDAYHQPTGGPDAARVVTGGGACGALIRGIDWAATPLGPAAGWPVSLRSLVQTLLDAKHPMLLFWGPELVQFYNDAFVPSFGSGKHPRALGQRGRECWAEVWPVVGAQIEAVMADGTSTWQRDALVPIHRNGRMEEVFWSYGYSPAYGDDGSVAGTLVIVTEVTDGVLANRRLQLLAKLAARLSASETPRDVVSDTFAVLAGLSADIPFAAAVHRNGTLVACGEAADDDALTTVLGQTAASDGEGTLPAARRLDLDSPTATHLWPEPVASVFVCPYAGGRIVFGLCPRLPFDAAYREFLLHIVETMQAAHVRLDAVTRRLRSDRERRDLLMQAPVAAALLVGPDLVFELANARYVEMVGREVVGRRFFEAFPEVIGTPVQDAVEKVFRTGEPFSTDEMSVRLDRAGVGEPVDAFFKFNLEPIRDATGDVTGLMAVAVEITDIVNARQQQARAHAERAALVERLEQASRAKDEFLAILGHELRNPLAPIITALEIIKLREDGAFTHEHAIIERQSRHLIRLVDDLLDVARIVGGKVELKAEKADIGAVIANAIEIAESLIEQRGQRLTVSIPHPITWWGDPARLAQIVSNLLTNASRYTEPGGSIDIAACEEGGRVRIRVTDDGEGIAPAMIDRIFDAFTQGHRDASRAQGGLGLGLTLARNLVELHGGTIEVSSDGPGHGSTFVVNLPATCGSPQEPAPVPVAAVARRRILVVDDNQDAAALLGIRLESAGHVVEVVHDGPAALEAFARHPPDVAILDIGLPVMDGYELARRIGEMQGSRQCRLVAVTGYSQPADRERSAAAGFHVHLVKPVDFDTLVAALAADAEPRE